METVTLIAESRDPDNSFFRLAGYCGQFRAMTKEDADVLSNVIPARVERTTNNPSGSHHWSYPDALSDVLMSIGYHVTIHCHSGLVMVDGQYQD